MPPGERVAEAELVDRAATGDATALAELVRRYHLRLIGLATSVTGRRDLAEDVAQETWIAVQRGLPACRDRSAFRGWLFAICANRARSLAARDTRGGRVLCLAPDVLANLGDAEPAVAAEPDETELLGRVRSAIHALPGGQRIVLQLHDVDGLPAGEVCARLGITAANQRVLLHRGRRGVRRALQCQGGPGRSASA